MHTQLRSLAARIVRRGSRKVLWTQSTANLGNFLYDWMHAFNYQRRGLDIVCLRTPAMEPWMPVFGAAAEALVLDRASVRLTDRREKGLYAEFGKAFDVEDLHSFAQGFIEPSGVIAPERVPTELRLGQRDVLVNIRRGDYVSVEDNRRRYTFDTDEYLTAALERSRETGGPIERILVVSDGIDWCVDNLAWLESHCDRLSFETEGLPPPVHLALLANAPRLVLANSTFSYWGGYLSEWRHRRPEQIVAPWFLVRDDNGGAAWHLDPRWSVVRDIPSGWALP